MLGGGTAGCVLAARLSEDPDARVCLVEAGPDYGPYADGRWPDDILDARWLAFSHAWETDREDRSQLRARILGGCSSHNACVVLEGAPADYDEWGHGWSYETIRPYLDRAREQLRTRELGRDELTPWHAAFADAARDAIVHPVNAVGTVRWNAAFAYLDAARGRAEPDDPRRHARRPRAARTATARSAPPRRPATSKRTRSSSLRARTARPGSCSAAASTECARRRGPVRPRRRRPRLRADGRVRARDSRLRARSARRDGAGHDPGPQQPLPGGRLRPLPLPRRRSGGRGLRDQRRASSR